MLNIGSGRGVPVRATVKELCAISGCAAPVHEDAQDLARPVDIPGQQADITRARCFPHLRDDRYPFGSFTGAGGLAGAGRFTAAVTWGRMTVPVASRRPAFPKFPPAMSVPACRRSFSADL